LIVRYRELCSGLGMNPYYILCRVKQWLRMTNHDRTLSWFDKLKECQDLGELLTRLEQVGSLPSCRPFPGPVPVVSGEPAA